MSETEVFEILKEIAGKVTGSEAAFKNATMASDFREDLGMDSISVLYMVLDIEKRFKIRFDNKSIAQLKSVGDVVDYVLKHQK